VWIAASLKRPAAVSSAARERGIGAIKTSTSCTESKKKAADI
jgi:hypothetical protein